LLDTYAGARVIVMPAAAAPLRKDERLFSYRERFHLLRSLFQTECRVGSVILSRLEKTLPLPNYTFDTLTALARICGIKPMIVLGEDQAANLNKWHNADQLMRDYEFVVFARRGPSAEKPFGLRYTLIADFDEDISATALRHRLHSLPPAERLAAAAEFSR